MRVVAVLLLSLLCAWPAAAQGIDRVRRAQSRRLQKEAYEDQKAKRFAEAQAGYEQALELWPENDQALNNLAWMLLTAPPAEGQDPSARAKTALGYAERAVAAAPNQHTHLDTLAKAQDAVGRPAEAAFTAARAVHLGGGKPAYARPLQAYAEKALKAEGLPPERRARLLRLAALGRFRAGAKGAQLEQALTYLDQSEALTPPAHDLFTLRARILVALKRDEPAVTAANQALAAGSKDPGLRRLRGEALLRLGRFDAGAGALRELSGMRPKDYGLRLRLANLYGNANRPYQAADVVASALKELDAHGPLWPDPWAQKACASVARTFERIAGISKKAKEQRVLREQAIAWWVRAQAHRQTQPATKALRALLEGAKHPMATQPPVPQALGLAEEVLGQTRLPRYVNGSQQVSNRGGGRMAFGDVDGDGDPDLWLSGPGLLLNDGAGRFSLARGSGVAGGRGAVFADYDRDGDLDLFVSGAGKSKDRLLRNDTAKGAVRFANVTAAAGLSDDGLPGEGLAWADLNGDRFPDLYLANYEQKNARGATAGTADRLWLSDGKGRFQSAHGTVATRPALCGRGVNPADFDQDGDVDVYVSNYRLQRNLFFVNDGGELRQQAGPLGVEGTRVRDAYGHTIGSAWGDLDGDGDLDLITANLAHPRFIEFSDTTAVFLQEEGRFTRLADRAGIRFEETHSHPLLWDMDDDGDLDLLLTCVYGDRPSFTYRNRLVEDGALRFEDVSWATSTRIYDGWGAASADVDGDGDLDLAVAGKGGLRLWLSQGVGKQQSVRVRLRGQESDTWGAYAAATLAVGERRLVRQITLGSGTGCQSEPVLHFGVGEAKGPFELSVRWPSGKTTTARVGPGRWELAETDGRGKAKRAPWPKASKPGKASRR